MKKTIFYVWCVLFPLLLQLYSCSEDEAPPIDLATISKVYRGDELKIFFNGVEYSSEDEAVALTVPSLVGWDNPDEVWQGDGEKMLLEILPLWPEVLYESTTEIAKNPIIEVDAISTPDEVRFTGSYSDSPNFYLLEVEGIVQHDVLTIHLTYTEHTEKVTGNTFLFRFDASSLDFPMLHSKVLMIEYGGQQIPVKDFVRDALTPVLRIIGERLEGDLQVEFLEDGSTRLCILSEDGTVVTEVPGWHGYRLHNEWGYLCSDIEGGSWLFERICNVKSSFLLGELYGWCIRNLGFISVFYKVNYDSALWISLESPTWRGFEYFLAPWLEMFASYLTEEEKDKAWIVSNMISAGELDIIFIRGEKVN